MISPVLILRLRPGRLEAYVPPVVKPGAGLGVRGPLLEHTGVVYENPVTVGAPLCIVTVKVKGALHCPALGVKI